MNPSDALHGEMPGFPFPGRPGGEHDEPLLDMIFDGRVIPPDAPREMHDLERMLAALAGPAEPGELAGEAAARAAFSRFASPVGISPVAPRPALHRLPRRPVTHRVSRRPVREGAGRRMGLAAALGVAAALLVGTAAAYTGVLPEPIQQVAHVTFGAPAPHHAGAPAPGPGGSGAAGHGQGPADQTASPRPTQPAATGRAHGQAEAAKHGHEPPRTGQQPDASCTPGSFTAQSPPGVAPGFPPPPEPKGPRCPGNAGQGNGQGASQGAGQANGQGNGQGAANPHKSG
jgi:hypothetical protein